MTVLSVKQVRGLGDELQRDPLQHANHAVSLLNCVKADVTEPVVKAAVQALKLFYISQHDDGAVGGSGSNKQQATSNKRQRLDPAAAAGAGEQQQQQQDEAQQQYAAWLSRQYSTFTGQLLQLCTASSSASLQVAAVSALMECVRHEVGPAAFSNRLYSRLLTGLVLSRNTQPEVIALLAARYLPCWDVRYHTLRTLSRLAHRRAVRAEPAAAAAAGAATGGAAAADNDSDAEDDELSAAAAGDGQQQQQLPKAAADVARAMFDVLASVQPILPQQRQQQQQQEDEEQEEVPSWCGASEAGLVKAAAASGSVSAKARRKRKQQQQQVGPPGAAAAAAAVAWASRRLQQREYQAAWLAFLRTDLPSDIYKKVLLKVHSDVLPAMSSPLLLSDFLSNALDQGGFEGMLALNGLFTLVTRHGLEYPAFYARLYGLITPEAFTNKHRSQFFRLADIFLASGMVPAYTAAAFAKRMARLALTAPPAGALLSVAFVHNIIRRHPACMVMLHKPTAAGGGSSGSNAVAGSNGSNVGGVDVYDPSEPDPAKSRAVESSLWELEALRNHYSPQVAAMCTVLDKDLSDRVRTSEVDVGPLLTSSYASLLQQELGRKLRKGVAVAFYGSAPAGLFDGGLLGDDLAGWDLC